MPFTDCPECRLTVYVPPAYTAQPCPRCSATLGAPPRSLFRSVSVSRIREQAKKLEGAPTAAPNPPSSPLARLSSSEAPPRRR